MKEELPAPPFNANRYERPNQNWICGAEREGRACRVGPDSRGRCRATFECNPALELSAGELKGRYRCTRPKEEGGPCEAGPLPNGACSRPIPKCQPLRSLRAKRRLFTISITALTVALLILALAGPLRLQFINPRELSTQHSTVAFARSHGVSSSKQACSACHSAAALGAGTWLEAAFAAQPGPFEWKKLFASRSSGMTRIDQACQRCHTDHTFHQPNVVQEHSCSDCHREHLGSGPLRQPSDESCASCHGNAHVMLASFEKGKALPMEAFDYRPDRGRLQFKAPRPNQGYTKVFREFASGHPEFQLHTENLREANTLKFNHQRHFRSDIPALNGTKLECASCHQPDASGVFHQKIDYETHCAACHALQFDADAPELPHGNPAFVRAFLRSLPKQYADYAAKVKKFSTKDEEESFVRQKTGVLGPVKFKNGEALRLEVVLSEPLRVAMEVSAHET